MSLRLSSYLFPTHNPTSTPILILHGLFGSAKNWKSIARMLTKKDTVWAIDLPNHGTSSWIESISYIDMAHTIAVFIKNLGQGPVDVIGHSMGGKCAMCLALMYSDLVRRLLVIDISPVEYDHHFASFYIKAMKQLPLEQVSTRRDAEKFLAQYDIESTAYKFLLQNLTKINQQWTWTCHLDGIENSLPLLFSFPSFTQTFSGYTLFIKGEHSEYIQPQHVDVIEGLFPNVQISTIHKSGHWLHVEQPELFFEHAYDFLIT